MLISLSVCNSLCDVVCQDWQESTADETDAAGDGDRAADAEGYARYHHQPQPADIDAEALRGFLAEAERAKGVALAEENDARPRR